MKNFWNFFDPVVQNKYFSPVAGFISLLNPFAMLPQLWSCISLDKIVGVSAPMYVLFALMQVVFSLVAIKARNFLMFLSMIVSVIISISIVIITLIKIGFMNLRNFLEIYFHVLSFLGNKKSFFLSIIIFIEQLFSKDYETIGSLEFDIYVDVFAEDILLVIKRFYFSKGYRLVDPRDKDNTNAFVLSFSGEKNRITVTVSYIKDGFKISVTNYEN